MPTVWLLLFINLNNHVSSPVAIFSSRSACLTTARIEWRAANQRRDTGRHFACENFAISTEAGLNCEPYISKTCLLKAATKPVLVWSPNQDKTQHRSP